MPNIVLSIGGKKYEYNITDLALQDRIIQQEKQIDKYVVIFSTRMEVQTECSGGIDGASGGMKYLGLEDE